MIKPIYEAEASILIPQKENNFSNMLNNLGININDMPNLPINLNNKSYNTTSDFITILKSRLVSKKIIEKLNLDKNEEFLDKDNNTFQTVVENFREKVKVLAPSTKDNAIRIKVRTQSKDLSIKIADLHFEELKKFIENNNYLSATKNRKFIEKQLLEISKNLKKEENALMNFKVENKTVSLPEEVNQYIKYISEIDAQELKSKMELNDISERIKISQKNVSDFDEQLQNIIKDLKISQAGLKTKKVILEEAKNKYLILLNSLPAKALILARLEREVKVKNTLYLLFTQQYEIAKLEEAKEMEPFKILDKAYASDKAVFPKKIISIIVTFILSIFISFITYNFLNPNG